MGVGSGAVFISGVLDGWVALGTTGAGRTEFRCDVTEGRLATSITGRDEFDCII